MQPLLSKATLMVVPNPFASPLNAEGMPHAFVAFDPEHLRGEVRHIGATLERKVTKPRDIISLRQGDGRGPQQYSRVTTKVVYDLKPTGIVDSAYHRQLVEHGALLPADEATAILCKVVTSKKPFEPPMVVMEREITARIAEWCSDHPGETLTPANWLAVMKNHEGLAERSPVVASTAAERIAARKQGAKIGEGDGLVKTMIPAPVGGEATTLTEAPSAGSTP